MACAFQVSRQHLDCRGIPLDGALLYCYMDGTTELYNTYRDSYYTQLNPNPLELDSRGSCKVYWDGSPVRFELWYNGEIVETWEHCTESVSAIEEHIHNYNNPHQVTAQQVGTYTSTEIDSKLNGKLDRSEVTSIYDPQSFSPVNGRAVASAVSGMSQHISDHNNPHHVTAEQIGTYSTTEIDAKFNEYGLKMEGLPDSKTIRFTKPS